MRGLKEPSFKNWSAIHPWSVSAQSQNEYQSILSLHSSLFTARRLIEAELEQTLTHTSSAVLPGYCWVCRSIKGLKYDLRYSNGSFVNWRERLACPTCGLNNRMRLIAQWFDRMPKSSSPSIYITEHVTELARYFSSRYPRVVTSEYLGESFAPGQMNARGVRHEDITSLGFNDSTFDHVLSFDVLEHVPSYKKALTEFYRVLKPGGRLVMTAPFVGSYENTLVRSKVSADGKIEHILEPEYHGDPIHADKGILCFYHFGWELIKNLTDAQFIDAGISLNWSLQHGHIGTEQILIFATKQS